MKTGHNSPAFSTAVLLL